MDDKKKGPSISEKIKEGVSVQELETLARKYTFEVFMILAIIIAAFSSMFDFFTGPKLSIFFAAAGAAIAIAFPVMTIKLEEKFFSFVNKQEKVAQIAIGVVRIAVALFVPFILFLQIGVLSGLGFHHFCREKHPAPKKDESKKPSESDEEI